MFATEGKVMVPAWLPTNPNEELAVVEREPPAKLSAPRLSVLLPTLKAPLVILSVPLTVKVLPVWVTTEPAVLVTVRLFTVVGKAAPVAWLAPASNT